MPPKSDVALQLAERIRSRAGTGTIAPPDSVYEWARRYRFLDKHEFSLDRFKPLHALYEDDWQRIVVMKPAQRGVSEWAINLACFALEYGARKWVPDGSKSGINVAIIFPARGDLIDFSKERLSNLKDETTHMAAMFAGEEFDSLGFKQVGDSFLYLRGGYSEAGLRSFPCDVLILDEYDQLDTSAIALARRRMNASMIRREVRISTPTIPGRGISAAYVASDQRAYESCCPYCGSWHTYDFFTDVWCDGEPWDEWQKWSQAHVEVSTVELRCPSCKVVQTEEDRCAPGRWISNAPEATRVHGYHIPWWPFPKPMVELDALAASAVSGDPTELEEFYRSDLGLPHGAGGGVIDEEMLRQLSALLPEGLPDGPWRDTVLGADIGARIHYCIDSIGPDNAVYVRKMGSVSDWDALDLLMTRYQVRNAVIDAEPEVITALDFCHRWTGRAIRCFYPTSATALKGTLFNRKEGTPDVQANRTMLLDTMYAAIASASERWPSEITSDPEVIQHMANAVRVKVTDEGTGQQRYSWVRTGPDHLMHGRAYAILARRLLPAAQSNGHVVSGTRPLIADYQRIAQYDLGGLGRSGIPSWIPPAVR